MEGLGLITLILFPSFPCPKLFGGSARFEMDLADLASNALNYLAGKKHTRKFDNTGDLDLLNSLKCSYIQLSL